MKMKALEVIKIIVIISVALGGYSIYKTHFKDGGTVTVKEFREYKKEFKQEIDTLNFKLDRNALKIDTLAANQDTLKRNIDSLLINDQYIKYDLDSIKNGQIIIYRKLSEFKEDQKQDRTFLKKLRNLIH
jgi:uncharacterized protein YxeA